ncbi:MATE efflux family protein 3, chloroplastic [Hordeum vulgare]|nr:MATE efflux family protein 3, chloroplastic [Hordeum vulgare]
MASVISDGGGGDMGGGDGDSDDGDGGTSLDGVGSFSEVDNWLGSTSYAMQAGLQQPEVPLVQSSPTPGCFMGCSEGYGESDYMYYVKEEGIGYERVKYLGNEASVHEMLEVFHHVKVVNIKVVRNVQPASSTQANENYMNTQERCSVKKVVEQSELQNQINDRKARLERSSIQKETDLNHFEGDTEVSEFCSDNSVHSDGSVEAVQMEIECASEEDRALEIECACEEDRALKLTTVVKHVKNPGPTSRCHNEFREALRDFHIRTSRIAHESTFCIKKCNMKHTCPASAENTKVTTNWLSKAVEPSLRVDPRTHVDALIKDSKVKFSVDVSRSVAYRAGRKAIKVVQGDQKEQYYRLRDYLQAVIDTNPGRVDGCFIKLITGQQILAATGRDGNNNIYPIAFGVVDKEDSDCWTWFLTQLRCCIGSGSKFGIYTIISDRQKSTGFRAAEPKKLVDQASYSFTNMAMN